MTETKKATLSDKSNLSENKPKEDKDYIGDLIKEHTILPRPGDLLEGTIISIGKNAVFVDLKEAGIGIIFGREIKENRQLFKGMKEGEKISAVVAEPENENGYIELSVRRAFREQAWGILQEIVEAKETVTAKITAANRGGLIVNVNGIIGFLPVSQLSTENYPRVEEGDKTKILQHLNKFVNQDMAVRIIDLDPKEEKLIVSEKAVDEGKIKKILDQYSPGDIVEGEISGVVDFGAFIKFKPKEETADENTPETLEGLIHISELDWQLIEDPRKIVKVGDKVKAKIIGIENNRLSLSLKALKKDPWEKVADKYKEGDKIKGTVTKLNPFGAFVRLDKDIQGLIHISEFADQDEMRQQLKVGQEYELKIASIDTKAHKMALTLAKKAAAPKAEK